MICLVPRLALWIHNSWDLCGKLAISSRWPTQNHQSRHSDTYSSIHLQGVISENTSNCETCHFKFEMSSYSSLSLLATFVLLGVCLYCNHKDRRPTQLRSACAHTVQLYYPNTMDCYCKLWGGEPELIWIQTEVQQFPQNHPDLASATAWGFLCTWPSCNHWRSHTVQMRTKHLLQNTCRG